MVLDGTILWFGRPTAALHTGFQEHSVRILRRQVLGEIEVRQGSGELDIDKIAM